MERRVHRLKGGEHRLKTTEDTEGTEKETTEIKKITEVLSLLKLRFGYFLELWI